MSGFGTFSQDAYDQLRAAYAAEALRADEQEAAGVVVGNDKLDVETAPVRNAWLDKTGLWQYPDGRGQYQDTEQKQQDLLAALRNEEWELPEETDEGDLDSMSDEEIDTMIDEILEEINAEDGEGGEEEEEVEVDVDDLTDEEFDKLVKDLLAEIDEELEGDVEYDDNNEGGDDIELSAEEISERIAQLKAELAALTSDNEEEEPEETKGEEEETESEVIEEQTEEEEPSDDESA